MRRAFPRSAAFTLVEMMMVIAIVSILAAMSLAALAGAAEEGKRQRARTQIAKLDQLIMDKWNSYRFRQLPIRIPVNERDLFTRRERLEVMRELQRMEMPERLNDILDPPVQPVLGIQDPALHFSPATAIPPQPLPSLTRAYQRRFAGTTAAAAPRANDQAECLYAIIAEMRDGERSALDAFLASEIGDTDQDGALEILDPWGTPIMWLRWAPGFSKYSNADMASVNLIAPVAPAPITPVGVDTFQIQDGNNSAKPDPFDPLKADPRHNNPGAGFKPFELRPLIICAGPDRVYDIYTEDATNMIHSTDPYQVFIDTEPGIGNIWVGTPRDYTDTDGTAALGDGLSHGDNITNHGLSVEVGAQ